MRALALFLAFVLVLPVSAVIPAVAWAANTTLWVDATPGADCSGTYNIATRACDGSDGDSYTTSLKGLTNFALLTGGGNVLEYRAGTYTETAVYGNSANAWPLATSWATANIIRNRAGEVVTIKDRGWNFDEAVEGGDIEYLIIESDSRSNFIHDMNVETGDQNGYRFALAHFIRLNTTTLQNFTGSGISGGSGTCASGKPTGIEILNNLIQHNGDNSSGEFHEHGIYPVCSDSWIIDGNYFKENFANPVSIFSSTANNHLNARVSNNVAAGRRSTATTGTVYGLIVFTGSGNKFYNNVVILKSGTGPQLTGCFQVGGTQTGPEILFNTCYGNAGTGIGIQIGANVTAGKYQNNLFAAVNNVIDDLGGGGTISYNLCPVATPDCHDSGATNTVETDTPGFVSAGTDFNLADGSAAINAATPLAGYPGYNDIGAYQYFTPTACVVENDARSVISVTVNPSFTPVQLTNVTGYSARQDAGGHALSSAAAAGPTTVELTALSEFSAGTSIDMTYVQATGNTKDGADINATNQAMGSVTQLACQNNIANEGSPPTNMPLGLFLQKAALKGPRLCALCEHSFLDS